ncbi:alpha-L-rhamnosidase [Spirosomataceae bacterium TFI 002]|nr:alpha-L-rhamnosidase [Spirosomataceae bacterium TFI 002]
MHRILTLVGCFLLSISSIFAQFSLNKLQVNYENTPLGTDIAVPQFSWQMKGEQKGLAQSAYQIVVSDEANKVVWDSKKVNSAISHAIQYNGGALQARTKYTWKLKVYGNDGKSSVASSWFETGLMNPSINAWSGAQWIGGGDEDINLHSQYLSMYKLSFDVQLDKATGATKAAFLFGANDERLANENLNIMHVSKGKNESYIALEYDISGLAKDGTAKLNVYRVGYDHNDQANVPFKVIDIPNQLVNKANQYDKHQILAECNFGVFEFYIDGTSYAHHLKDREFEAQGRGPSGQLGLNLNPAGKGNNAISFPMLADIGLKTEQGQKAYFSDIVISNYRNPSNPIFEDKDAHFFTSLPSKNNVYEVPANTLVTANPSKNAVPMLRTVFETKKKEIKKARIYATARGIYELHLNGQKVSADFFNPGLTQYNKHHMYQTYDVTSLLKSNGSNALGAWLAEGWWSGNATYLGENWNFFGDRSSLLTKMVVTYIDGTEQVITSNTKDWKLYTDGPIRVGSFFQGEIYDATKEAKINGWGTANYNDTNWKAVQEVPLKGNVFVQKTNETDPNKPPHNYDDFKLIGQYGGGTGVVKTLTAQTMTEPRPGFFVYDMAQNMVGVPRIKIKGGKKGQLINIRFAEVLYPDLAEYKGNEGMLMTENLRTALVQDQYILKGGDEIIEPRFTFHGYRFLEITGIEKALPLSDVEGLVISSVQDIVSSYETNNPLVNKLWENVTWSLRSNFLSIPTDCPQRNERMGWSGDISVFSRVSTYMADAGSFLRKHMMAMRDIQAESGRFTDVAPVGGGFGGTLWGSAGIVVAWEAYSQYGDIQLLQEHYDAMKSYIAFLETRINEDGILDEGPLGDWLSPEVNKNDNTLFWMSYFSYDLEIMAKMAQALGKNADAEAFLKRSEEIKVAFNRIYVDKTTKKTIKSGVKTGFMRPPGDDYGNESTDKGQLMDTQASYAIPLAFGTFNEENTPYAIKNLSESITRVNLDDKKIERPPFSLMTGFIGTAAICEALSISDKDDIAYELLTNEQYPSWLYPVVNGATSVWERLNSYTVENGFGGNNSMNSFNHYSFGAVASWMYNYSLGIQRHSDEPAFKHFVLKPTPDPTGKIKFAKGYYDSMYGRIISEWANTTTGTTYKFKVPANSSAMLYLKANSISKVSESGKTISNWEGVKADNGEVSIPLTAGTYEFIVK